MGVKSSVDRHGPTVVADGKFETKMEAKQSKQSEDEVMAFSDSPRGSPRGSSVNSKSPIRKPKKQVSHPSLKLPIETIDFDVERDKEELMLMQDLESPSKDMSRDSSYRSYRK